MTARLLRRVRGSAPDGGAVLVLALLFVLIVGLVGGAIASLASTNLADTSVLGGDQSQSYAAQSAVQVAIDDLRAPTALAATPGYGGTACPPTTVSVPAAGPAGAAQQITVLCAFGFSPQQWTRTVVFAACLSSASCLAAGPDAAHPFTPTPGNAAIVVATTIFNDLKAGCTGYTGQPADPCFVPGTSVAVSGWNVSKSAA